MFYLNLAIDQRSTRLRCQHVAVLLVVFLIAILSVGCSKQPSTTADDAQSLEQTDAELMASGQWRDPDTGLIWMRCSIGQIWTGDTCEGDPLKFTSDNVKKYFAVFNKEGFAGEKNWRLPLIEELVSLRRCTKGWGYEVVTESRLTTEGQRDFLVYKGIKKATLPNGQSVPKHCTEDSRPPHIDIHVFPRTPTYNGYWSASPHAVYSSHLWYVDFFYSGFDHSNSSHLLVRAVRNP